MYYYIIWYKVFKVMDLYSNGIYDFGAYSDRNAYFKNALENSKYRANKKQSESVAWNYLCEW